MMTLGIDVGKTRHNATLLDEEGKKVFHNLAFANNPEGLTMVLARIADSNLSVAGIQAGMEATGHYWINLYGQLAEAGFAGVDLINPIVIHARKNESIRGAKTDRVDALRIARYLREADRKISALPNSDAERARYLARTRYDLTMAASAEKNRLISALDRVFPEYRDQFSDLFGRASLEVLAMFPTADAIAKVDVRRLTNTLKKASRGRLGRSKADQLKQAARASFAVPKQAEYMALEIRFLVDRLNLLLHQIAQLDQELATMLVEEQTLLQSLPGIGPVWAPLIAGEIQPVFRPEHKDGAGKLVAYAGLDAKPNKSGRDYATGADHARMSKRGSKYLRTAVMQASEVAALVAQDPMFADVYRRQRAKEKPHKVALSHVANKMLHVIFAVLRDKKKYRPIMKKQNG